MLRPSLVVSAAVLSLVVVASPAAAQLVPGVDHRGRAGSMSQFRAEIWAEIQPLIHDWKTAWETDDPAEVARFYAPDATLYAPDGSMGQSAGVVRERLAELLPRVSEFNVAVVDFDVKGYMAYVGGPFTYVVHRDGAPPHLTVGHLLLVLVRGFHGWEIRAQMMREEPKDIDRSGCLPGRGDGSRCADSLTRGTPAGSRG